MDNKLYTKIHALEQGDTYFFYRPKVRAEKSNSAVHIIHDIQSFFIILHPLSYIV